MKRTTGILKWGVLIVLVALSGCSKHLPDSEAIQGTWKENVSGANTDPLKAVFSGTSLNINGNDANEQCATTFTLDENASPKQISAVVTSCPIPELNSKTLTGTYELSGDTLILTGYKSKNPALPVEFSMMGQDKVVLKFSRQ